MTVRQTIFSVLFILMSFCCSSQKYLRLAVKHFGHTRTYNVFQNEDVEYKLKGQVLYRKARILNMNDSILLLDNDSVVDLHQLKAIKCARNSYILKIIGAYALRLGVALFALNAVNHLITENSAVPGRTGVIVSSALLAMAITCKETNSRRIRINDHAKFKVFDGGFENLAPVLDTISGKGGKRD